MSNAQEYLKNLSDKELSALVEDLKNTSFGEDSPLRKAVNEIYKDDVGIFVLRIPELMYPILLEVHLRFVR